MLCMTPEQLSLYLDDRLEDDARERFEEHLSRCASCRRRLVEAHEAARPEPIAAPVPAPLVQRARAMARRQRAARRRRAGLWWGTAAAAIAAIVSLVALDLGRDGARLAPTDPDALRSGEDHGPLRLQAVAPDDGAVVTGAIIALRWTALPGATRTTVTVVDRLGNIVLRTTATGDQLLLDPAATDPPLEPGVSWFWYVTADLADGTSLESEVRAFTLAAVP